MKYKASLDKQSEMISVVVTLVFILSIVVCLVLFSSDKQMILLIVPIFLIIAYFSIYILRPLGYIITNDVIIIRRIAGNKEIKLNALKGVSVVNKKDIANSVRIFGVGGLFGYFGNFSNAKWGKMTWYITRMDQLVLIETIDKCHFLLSPDEPEPFVKTFLTDK